MITTTDAMLRGWFEGVLHDLNLQFENDIVLTGTQWVIGQSTRSMIFVWLKTGEDVLKLLMATDEFLTRGEPSDGQSLREQLDRAVA
ncbi:hypothetical protein [Synechococcus sp. PCC 6312]|uniref:hypothetical protein n=1 Tax=Synechococcus sp. (strain ATCC 27167 / PCC 6312) TaxID=195253 RepID=UPI00029EF3A3|nr:hypothetical protein [Synechococcus sp. PCC 6312]AFY61205.1 hypothetical protein Syn6312_2080 [Synechococcus sp. PCC 6312]